MSMSMIEIERELHDERCSCNVQILFPKVALELDTQTGIKTVAGNVQSPQQEAVD